MSETLSSGGVQSTKQSNGQNTIQSVLLKISSCAHWDPGGLDLVDIQALEKPCSVPWLAGCTSRRLRLVLTEKHPYESAENGHRLGGKPVVKEEGMSATQLLPRPHRPTIGSQPTKRDQHMGLGRREPAGASSYISTGESNKPAIRAWIRNDTARRPPPSPTFLCLLYSFLLPQFL